MKLACPSCHNPIDVTDVDTELSAQVSCGNCAAVVGITVTVSILSAGSEREADSGAPRVVLAMTDRDLRDAYARALVQAGFAVIETGESRQTLQVLGREAPHVAVVDGGFSAIFGMGIGEIIKKSNVTRDTRVLGLRTDGASPLPVPGSDRTVPMTVGADTLVLEVQSLLKESRPAAPAPSAPPAEAVAPARRAPTAATPSESIDPAPAPAPRQARERTPMPPPAPRPAPARPAAPPASPGGVEARTPAAPAPPTAPPEDPEHAAAQRLARIIVSDVALYNQNAVEEGLRTGRLREALVPLMQEGRQHYEERTPDHVRAATDYLETALDQFVARKTKAMRPAAV